MGGLADIKAERIRAILATLLEERGKICMEYLREMSDDEIKAELSRQVGMLIAVGNYENSKRN